ncbi:MAG: S41 family peptidase [Dehalococcoidales bacterium]|nr:S41 family peptidase [Dehalococcoidales bacterium]
MNKPAQNSKTNAMTLITVGLVIGILVSTTYVATASETKGIAIEELRRFAEVFRAINRSYVEPVDDRTLIRGSIKGMLSRLDPYSEYFEPGDNFYASTSQAVREMAGIGLELGMEGGNLKVVTPLEGTPSERADIRPDDLIIKIDDHTTQGMTLDKGIKLLRGKSGSPITLTILRKGAEAPMAVTLQRQVIRLKSVKSWLIAPGLGYVRISTFQDDTVETLASHLLELYGQGPLNGLVLDLRGNSGGLLASVIGVAAAFLPTGSRVAISSGRTAEANRVLTANPEFYTRSGKDVLRNLPDHCKTVPMVVLVNHASAAGSEIVAGALQDHKRATILGQRTYGLSLIQTVLPMWNGSAIKLTTARWHTPNGKVIQSNGVTPDIQSIEAALTKQYGTEDDQELNRAVLLLNKAPVSGFRLFDF